MIARALRQLISDLCEEHVHDKAALRECVSGPVLLDYMKNVSFMGQSGQVTFDEDGDLIGNYVVNQLIQVIYNILYCIVSYVPC